MNKLFLIFVLMLAGCLPAFAQTNTISDAKVLEFLNSPMNFVKNPFARYNTNDVTCVNATKNRDVVTDPLFGISAHTFVGTALNGYCEYALRPIDNPYKDFKGGCEFGVFIKGDASLYRLIIYDGTATEKIRSASTLGNNTGFTYYSLPYQCQATPRIRLVQTAAGTGQTVRLGVYYGPAKSIAYGTPPTRFTAKISSAGVVSDESPVDWINGNCGTATPYPCTFVSGIFTQAPNCQVTAQNTGAVFGNIQAAATATGVSFQGVTSNTAAATNTALVVSCDKVGADVVQPAVTAQNWNYPPRAYTPTITGAGTVSAVSFTESRRGAYLRVNFSFNAGTVTSGNVTLTLPSGMTANVAAARVIGSWNSQGSVGGGPLFVSPNSNLVVFSTGTNWQVPLTGTQLGSASIVTGFFEVPIIENGVPWQETWNALQLNGSVVADTNVKADKAAGITSIDYGTYSAVVTGGANTVSVTSPTTCNFLRIGTFVSVTCTVIVGCASVTGTSDTNFTVSLPISTTNPSSIYGSMGFVYPQEAGRIFGGTSTAASANFRCFLASAYNRPVVFSYSTQ